MKANQKPNSVSAVRFPKTDFCGLGTVFFTLSHSQTIFQHDRINRQSIFLHVIFAFLVLNHFG